MKRYTIAAAALLLGTSALAWAPSGAPSADEAKIPAVAMDPIVKPTVQEVVEAKNSAVSMKEASASWSEGDPALDTASIETWNDDQPEPDAGDPDLDLSDEPAADEPVAEAGSVLDDAATPAMGGPEEPAETAIVTTAAADLTPRSAAHNYPPCAPGPGDDNCIQLYEPGVRTALASWNQSTGGLARPGEAMASAESLDGSTTAVGGPYEPAGESETAMAGDGAVDPAAGETAEAELASADSGQYAGMGGPVAETGYPPCSPGPGDDRCIQLYEPGVTGAGN